MARTKHRPWHPVEYGPREVAAIQSLAAGQASPEQQKYALKWLVESVCATYDESYYPGGDEGRRDTDFSLGRRFVGQTIVKMMALSRSLVAGKPVEREYPVEETRQ